MITDPARARKFGRRRCPSPPSRPCACSPSAAWWAELIEFIRWTGRVHNSHVMAALAAEGVTING